MNFKDLNLKMKHILDSLSKNVERIITQEQNSKFMLIK